MLVRIVLPGKTVVVIAILMVVTAILFWAASAVEKKGDHPAAQVKTQVKAHVEGAGEEETAVAPEGSSARETEEEAARIPETQIMGINLEASWVPYAAAVVTVALVAALAFLGYPVLFLVLLFAAAGTFLDIRELVHQAAASRTALSLMVAAVALTRVATAAVALAALFSYSPGRRARR